MMTGQVHIYTGNGKGKTTAAFGLALRALMAGKKVYVGQFVKSMAYNETHITHLIQDITIEQFGCGCIFDRKADSEDLRKAEEGMHRCAQILASGAYDVVILDEVNIALSLGLIDTDTLIQALNARNDQVEVVLTGRYAPQSLIDYADLVTEMKEVKHYYQKGLLSRDGIDK